MERLLLHYADTNIDNGTKIEQQNPNHFQEEEKL